jgi:flagellar hook-length control protein FliK
MPAAGSVAVAPDALAASIIAMCRQGQSSLILRLDPPGLGALSVHVALGSNADVNVLFLPTIAQTAQLIHSGLGDLRQAMAASGVTLGQAQIGNGTSGGAAGGGSAGRDPTARSDRAVKASPAPGHIREESVDRGARAIA